MTTFYEINTKEKQMDKVARRILRTVSKMPANLEAGLFPAIALLVLCFTIFIPCRANAYSIPEKLVFDLTWMGIKAGTATQEISTDNGVTRIISTARSADWLSVFFPVEDRIETVLASSHSAGPGLPKTYRMKIHEGKTRRDKEITFDHAMRTALYVDRMNGEKKSFDIEKDTLDTLSSFYHLRSMPLEVGKSVFVTVFDGKRLWNTEIRVLRREKIKTDLGRFDTIVVQPLMKAEGIFDKRGDMFIWLTDDARRLPVKMKTKVPVGSVTATLVGGSY
jgi:hypothetical protein